MLNQCRWVMIDRVDVFTFAEHPEWKSTTTDGYFVGCTPQNSSPQWPRSGWQWVVMQNGVSGVHVAGGWEHENAHARERAENALAEQRKRRNAEAGANQELPRARRNSID